MNNSTGSSRTRESIESGAPTSPDLQAEALSRAAFLVGASTELLRASFNVDEIIQRVANLAVPAIADWCIVQVGGGDMARAAHVAAAHADPHKRDLLREIRFETSGQAELHEDVPASLFAPAGAEHRSLLERLGAASAIVVPMKARSQALGTILLVTGESGRRYGRADLEMAEQLAMKVALIVENARLYHSEERARTEISLLYRLVDGIHRAATLDELLELALDVVQEALGVERASILLYDANRVMRFRAWRGLSDTYRAAVDGHSPWTPDTQEANPILIADVESDPSIEAYRPIFRAEGIRALVFVPLIYHRRLIGKFMVYSATPRVFTANEIRLATSIAMQVANAASRKVAEAELEAARATAERASRMKDEFLAVVSHELRTPLSAIAGWTAILRSGRRRDPATIEKALEVIDRNVTIQTKIIDDILDVSRIITGKLIVNTEPTSLVAVVDEALDSVKTSAMAKEIRITCHHEDDPFIMVGDPDRLRQIVWNLLSNAIKFTPAGGRVDVLLHRELGFITIQVKDSGKGIAPGFMPHIFERFRQEDSSTTRGHGGLGLGLAIVRHLVELHGGHVRAESGGEGQGATFMVTFPVRAVLDKAAPAKAAADRPETAPPPPSASTIDLSGLRVLVVDDEVDAREMLKEILSHDGAIVETAASARQALEALRRFNPDVLVSDIGMPVEDGYALIREIRKLPDDRSRIPAVALTAYARPEDARRVLDAGYQRHVAKPTNPDTLAGAIAELAAQRQRSMLSRG